MKRGVIALAIVAAAVAFGYQQHGRDAHSALVAYGTLEAHNIDVGSKSGGRVQEVKIHEGEQVQADQVLVVLDDDELRPAAAAASAALTIAQANLAKYERGSRSEDIAEAEAAAADGNPPSGFRHAEQAQAEAELARARANADNAARRLTRARDLLARGMTPQQTFDDARTDNAAAVAASAAAEHAVAAAGGRWRAARAVTARTRTGFRTEDIAAARGEVARAEAALATAMARLAEHQVRAPRAAVVEVFDLRPGQLVAPNATVARLLEYDQLFVMVYVPEPRIGEVRLGAAVVVAVDAYPGRVFRGVIDQIRQRAEFLPRNVQTREERIHQVIGVKVRVADPQSELRAGTAAEVGFQPAAP